MPQVALVEASSSLVLPTLKVTFPDWPSYCPASAGCPLPLRLPSGRRSISHEFACSNSDFADLGILDSTAGVEMPEQTPFVDQCDLHGLYDLKPQVAMSIALVGVDAQ